MCLPGRSLGGHLQHQKRKEGGEKGERQRCKGRRRQEKGVEEEEEEKEEDDDLK